MRSKYGKNLRKEKRFGEEFLKYYIWYRFEKKQEEERFILEEFLAEGNIGKT